MTPTPPRWYVVSSDGVATLCADEDDARRGAAECDRLYPRHAPHAAVLLGDVAAERERWRKADGYAMVVHPDDAEMLRQLPDGQWVILQRRLPTRA